VISLSQQQTQQQTQPQTQPFGTMIPYDEVSSQAPVAEAKTGQKDIYDGVGYY
jgi:hypothetical protein